MLKDPNKRLHEIAIDLGTAFKPMLADSVQMGDIVSLMNHQPFYIEVKYDGERMLAHRLSSNGSFKFFSRNCHDFTSDFGSDAKTGKFAPFIEQALSSQTQTIILDGEICPFNKKTQTLAQKSEQMNIRQLKEDDETYQQCLVIYDLVFFNGKILTDLPLKTRLKILQEEAVSKLIPGRICFADRFLASKKSDIIEALNNAIDAREEGIMIKDPTSVYKPGARTKSGWIKVKPEYQHNLADTCDLVILGGYYYSGGKRHPRGTITHFLCGIKDKDIFRSFTRVSSGVSQKELYDLVEKLNMKDKKLYPHVKYGKERPDVTIDPFKSKVLKIRAAEVVRSETYDVGHTLR